MIGDATHRHAVALGQRYVQERRCFFRVVEKHLVKIAEPKQQQRIGRNAFPQSLVLLHHWRKCVLHDENLSSKPHLNVNSKRL